MSEDALAEVRHLSFRKIVAEYNVDLANKSDPTDQIREYGSVIENLFRYCHGLESFDGNRYAFYFDWFVQPNSSSTSQRTIAKSLKKLIDVELIWRNPKISRQSKDRLLTNFSELIELMVRDRQGIDNSDLQVILRVSASSLKTLSLSIERSPDSLTGRTSRADQLLIRLVSELPKAIDRLELIVHHRGTYRQTAVDSDQARVDLEAASLLRGLSLKNVSAEVPFTLPLLEILKCSVCSLDAFEQAAFWSSLEKSVRLNYLSISIRYVASRDLDHMGEAEESTSHDSLDQYLADFAERVNTAWKELRFLDVKIQNIVMSYQINEFLRVIIPRSLYLNLLFSTLASIKFNESELSSLKNCPHIKYSLKSVRGQNRISFGLRVEPLNSNQPKRQRRAPIQATQFRLKGEFDDLHILPPLIPSRPATNQSEDPLISEQLGTTEVDTGISIRKDLAAQDGLD